MALRITAQSIDHKKLLPDPAEEFVLLDKHALFDSHFHIIDPRFPLLANRGFLPEPFTCDDYLDHTKNYHLSGGVIVSASFQAFDQTYLIDALETLGPSFVGVTQVPFTVSDEEIIRLDKLGVRAVRFNLHRGGSLTSDKLSAMAERIYELAGWHTELYVDSTALDDLYKTLLALPLVSIDHLGLSQAGLKTLLKLVEKGVRVKATGFGRVDFAVGEAIKTLYNANPHALMFGTDLPSTRAPRPYRDDDFLTVVDKLDAQGAARVLSKNAVELYKPDSAGL